MTVSAKGRRREKVSEEAGLKENKKAEGVQVTYSLPLEPKAGLFQEDGDRVVGHGRAVF